MIKKLLTLFYKIHSKIPTTPTITHLKDLPEKPLKIIITSFNNEAYCEKNVESALNQNYKNYKIIYIDDNSTDGTLKRVKNHIKKHDKFNKVTLILNEKRNLKLKNLYTTIHTLADNEIVIELDGDDYLAHSNVLKAINQIYQQTHALMVYSNYQNQPTEIAQKLNMQKFSQKTPLLIKKLKLYRKYPWIYSGLRTYYAELFKKIPEKTFICPLKPYEGNFYPVSHDLVMMYPMLELSDGKVEYVKDVLLIRNIDSSINDFKIYDESVRTKINNYIRSKNVF
jgi:glycosyltransferase involved in cell wall biosynthesis